MSTQWSKPATPLAGVRCPSVAADHGCPTPDKKAYDSRAAAKKALRRVRIHRGYEPRLGCKLQAYLCPCGRFHLGNRMLDGRRDGTFHTEAAA